VLLTRKRRMGVRNIVTGRMEKRRMREGGSGREETTQVASTRGT
jgi:hypothetical protein